MQAWGAGRLGRNCILINAAKLVTAAKEGIPGQIKSDLNVTLLDLTMVGNGDSIIEANNLGLSQVHILALLYEQPCCACTETLWDA